MNSKPSVVFTVLFRYNQKICWIFLQPAPTVGFFAVPIYSKPTVGKSYPSSFINDMSSSNLVKSLSCWNVQFAPQALSLIPWRKGPDKKQGFGKIPEMRTLEKASDKMLICWFGGAFVVSDPNPLKRFFSSFSKRIWGKWTNWDGGLPSQDCWAG